MEGYSFLKSDTHARVLLLAYRTVCFPAACNNYGQAWTQQRSLEWEADARGQPSRAEVKARGPLAERTEGSRVIIKSDSSAPCCGRAASSSRAARLFVRLLCQCGWSRLFESMHFCSLYYSIGGGDTRAEDRRTKEIGRSTGRWRHKPTFYLFKSVLRLSIPIYKYLCVLGIHRARSSTSKLRLCCYVTFRGLGASGHVFLRVINLQLVPVGIGTHDASVVHKKTSHCRGMCLILLS